jgi:hypothetical protein
MLPILIAAITLAAAPILPADAALPWIAPAARCEALAGRLHVAPPLRPVVARMCRRAPTFRRQVVRLARAQQLDVTLSPAAFGAGARVRARTAMTRVAGELRSAVVEVPHGDALLLAELVAHEFEHIVEQLDGVDLAAWEGRSGVYRVDESVRSGAFETERARQVGRIVAGEVAAADAPLITRRAW